MCSRISETFHRWDVGFQKSFVGRYFQMEDRRATLWGEIRGALATFLSMAYILAVNPRIMADSGGPCIPDPPEEGGIFGQQYEACLADIRLQYITATAIGSMIGCFLMGIGANLPIALAPGMGINAYYTYTVVGWRGTGSVSYAAANTAIIIEGSIFLVLALTGVRYALVKLIPEPVRHATPAGIGAFLAHIGLQSAEGIGMIVSSTATAVTLGGCPAEDQTMIVPFTDSCQNNTATCQIGGAFVCDQGSVMRSPTTWVGILGLLITLVMLSYKRKGAFLVGIGFITIISWFRGTVITYFPYTAEGDMRFDYFKQVVQIEPMDSITANFTNDLKAIGLALVTFLYVDFFDTSGTLLGLVSTMDFVHEEGANFPRATQAFSADAIATIIGSIFSLSPVTSYIESGAGVEAGARTGLTAVLVGFCFFLSIFFAPIFASIPPWATGGVLIIVGSLMAGSLRKVKWQDPAHAATAFITFILMPLTYSIAYGLLGGFMTWIILQIVFFTLKAVGIHRPSFDDNINGGEGESVDVRNPDSDKNPLEEGSHTEVLPAEAAVSDDTKVAKECHPKELPPESALSGNAEATSSMHEVDI